MLTNDAKICVILIKAHLQFVQDFCYVTWKFCSLFHGSVILYTIEPGQLSWAWTLTFAVTQFQLQTLL